MKKKQINRNDLFNALAIQLTVLGKPSKDIFEIIARIIETADIQDDGGHYEGDDYSLVYSDSARDTLDTLASEFRNLCQKS